MTDQKLLETALQCLSKLGLRMADTLPQPVPSTALVKRFGYLRSIEREAIARVLRDKQGNIKQAAKFLGVTRQTLYNKMTDYGLCPNRPTLKPKAYLDRPPEKWSIIRLFDALGVPLPPTKKHGHFFTKYEGELPYLLKDAKDAWRRRIKEAHTDRGGTHEEAARINDVWKVVQRRFARYGITLGDS